MVFISSYIDTRASVITGITNTNGLEIAKLEFGTNVIVVMSPVINNSTQFQGNVRLTSNGTIILESSNSTVGSLTRMGFTMVTFIN